MSRNWSEQQQAIFEWFEHGEGNLVVRARAGTGKTTTIVEAVGKAPEQAILLCAFNKRIAKELTAKVAAAGARAETKTLHGVGYSIIMKYWDGCKADVQRGFKLAQRTCGEQAPDEMVKKVAKLAGIGKGSIVNFDDRDGTLALLEEFAARFDLEPDDEWQQEGWTTDKLARMAYASMELAKKRDEDPRPTCDFDDMLFLPLANGWARPRYDLIVVDEAQDMSAAQLELAQRVRNKTGRTAVVGDDRQAIYGFRGADSTALDRLKAELEAKELGLTCTYRCGKSIVAYARTLVPDFVAAETNAQGAIEALHESQLVATAQPGDFILSRKNAPLASICLRMLRQGKPARIEGKDVAAGLKAIVKRWKPISMGRLLGNIDQWEAREVEKIENDKKKAATADDLIELVKDKAAILRALCDGLQNPAELIVRLDTMFGDSEDDRRPAVVCSSIHKAKGLEAHRVFILKHTLYPQRARAAKNGKPINPATDLEEQNLEYVACTRAIDRLVWVTQ